MPFETTADQTRTVISVCTTCRAADGIDPEARPGERLLANLRDAAVAADASISIKAVQCLSVCKRPCTATFTGIGRYTYVFGDLDPERDAAALLEGARVYGEQEHGYLLWRERPEPLRRGIVARIPPPGWDREDGAHPR